MADKKERRHQTNPLDSFRFLWQEDKGDQKDDLSSKTPEGKVSKELASTPFSGRARPDSTALGRLGPRARSSYSGRRQEEEGCCVQRG